MTKDELVEAVADVLRGPLNDFSYASRLSVARAVLAIAMPAAFEMAFEAVRGSNADLTGDAGTTYRKCLEVIRELGMKSALVRHRVDGVPVEIRKLPGAEA